MSSDDIRRRMDLQTDKLIDRENIVIEDYYYLLTVYMLSLIHILSEKTKEILAMADCLFSGMKECESADYAPICLEYCRGLEVQLNQLIFEPFRRCV